MIEPTRHQNEVLEKFLDCAFVVHKELGPGLLERAYEECLSALLIDKNIPFERQKKIPVSFMNKIIEVGFTADFIIDNCVIIELKSIENIMPVHQAQLLTYMKLCNINLGLLINFNVVKLKMGIKRLVLSENIPTNYS